MTIQYFKATKETNRFNSNQKVWIRHNFDNHLYIRFRERGKGRYINGIIDKFADSVGEIKEIEVDEKFGKRVIGLVI